MGYSQLQEFRVPGIQGQAAQSSPRPPRSSWPLGLQGGIPSPSSDVVGKWTFECHSPGHSVPAWAQHLLFPEHGTATNCTLETVRRLQRPLSAHATSCPRPRRGGTPGPPAPAAGCAAAAGRPSCQLRTAGGASRPPGGAARGRPAPLAPAAPSFSSSPARSPATRPTPPGRRGGEAQLSLLRLPQTVPTTHAAL